MKIVERNSGARHSFASLALVLAACAALALAAGCSNFNTNGDDIQGSPASSGAGTQHTLTGIISLTSLSLDTSLGYDVLVENPGVLNERFSGGGIQSVATGFSFVDPVVTSGITYSYTIKVTLSATPASTPNVTVSVNGGTASAVSASNLSLSGAELTITGTLPISSDTTLAVNIAQ